MVNREGGAMNDDRVQHQQRFDVTVYDWLRAESEASGRSITWLVEHSVKLWRSRLERERRQRAKLRAGKRR